MSSSGTISKTGSVSRQKSTGFNRAWIFRGLTLIGGGMFLASWLMPWWQAWIVYLKTPALYVRPWGADSFLPPEYGAAISGYEMPPFFAPFMWAYLVVCMGALLYGMFVSSSERIGIGKLTVSPAGLVGLVGLTYILCVVVAVIVMQIRMSGFFNAPLNGSVYIGLDEGHKSYIDTSLQPGYYLACATGPYLVLLSLVHRFIVPKRKAK